MPSNGIKIVEDESICPICSKPIRSDADSPEFCALCGMGITHPEEAPSLDGEDGDRLYYCCSWCLRLHVREVRAEPKVGPGLPVNNDNPRPDVDGQHDDQC